MSGDQKTTALLDRETMELLAILDEIEKAAVSQAHTHRHLGLPTRILGVLPEIRAALTRFTAEDFGFQGALAADLLRRAWRHNPDIAADICAPFILAETEDGELGVWPRVFDEKTPALAVFGASDDDDTFEDAIVWLVLHRHDAGTLSAGHRSGEEAP